VGKAGLDALVEAFRASLELADDADLFSRAQAGAAAGDPAAFWRDDGSEVFTAELAPLRSAAIGLHHALLAPVGDLLQDARHLLVVPDGALHLVPFVALAAERSDGSLRFVGEEQTVSYLAAAGVRHAAAPAATRRRRLVALGDPDGSLPGAAEEARAIAALWPGGLALTGSAASIAALRALPPGAAYLHLATHGVLEGADPKESYLLLAGQPGRLSVRDLVERRDGLVLAGTRLVTLSACETRLGEGDPSALYGSLSGAFAAAGVAAVVASLWPVDDEATRFTMVSFYGALARGMPAAEALGEAQRQVRLDPRFAHPRYWAPFVLLGDAD
jgi:CHAT domain-containing protein